jgi:hypothetical protein
MLSCNEIFNEIPKGSESQHYLVQLTINYKRRLSFHISLSLSETTNQRCLTMKRAGWSWIHSLDNFTFYSLLKLMQLFAENISFSSHMNCCADKDKTLLMELKLKNPYYEMETIRFYSIAKPTDITTSRSNRNKIPKQFTLYYTHTFIHYHLY